MIYFIYASQEAPDSTTADTTMRKLKQLFKQKPAVADSLSRSNTTGKL